MLQVPEILDEPLLVEGLVEAVPQILCKADSARPASSDFGLAPMGFSISGISTPDVEEMAYLVRSSTSHEQKLGSNPHHV